MHPLTSVTSVIDWHGWQRREGLGNKLTCHSTPLPSPPLPARGNSWTPQNSMETFQKVSFVALNSSAYSGNLCIHLTCTDAGANFRKYFRAWMKQKAAHAQSWAYCERNLPCFVFPLTNAWGFIDLCWLVTVSPAWDTKVVLQMPQCAI